MLLGRASAVFLDIQCPQAPIRQGTQVTCDVDLMIRQGERIPIQNLAINVSGPTQLQALFGPFGNIISKDDPILEIVLLSQLNPGLGFGYGYGEGEKGRRANTEHTAPERSAVSPSPR